MDDKTFQDTYGLTEQDKLDFIEMVSQDITWLDDELMSQDETEEVL